MERWLEPPGRTTETGKASIGAPSPMASVQAAGTQGFCASVPPRHRFACHNPRCTGRWMAMAPSHTSPASPAASGLASCSTSISAPSPVLPSVSASSALPPFPWSPALRLSCAASAFEALPSVSAAFVALSSFLSSMASAFFSGASCNTQPVQDEADEDAGGNGSVLVWQCANAVHVIDTCVVTARSTQLGVAVKALLHDHSAQQNSQRDAELPSPYSVLTMRQLLLASQHRPDAPTSRSAAAVTGAAFGDILQGQHLLPETRVCSSA